MKLKTLTLKDIPFDPACSCFQAHEDFVMDLRDEVREWRDALRDALGMASKKDGRGYYNNTEVVIDGVTYDASTFEDDEAKPIIKFINQFFNLEGEGKKKQ